MSHDVDRYLRTMEQDRRAARQQDATLPRAEGRGDLEARIKTLREQSAYWSADHPQHKQVIDEVNSLYARLESES